MAKTDVPAPLPLPKPSEILLAETARHMQFADDLRERHEQLDGEFAFPGLVLEAAGCVPGEKLLDIPVRRAVVLAYMIGLQAGSEPFREKSPV